MKKSGYLQRLERKNELKRSALPAEDGYAPADVRGRGIPGGGGRV